VLQPSTARSSPAEDTVYDPHRAPTCSLAAPCIARRDGLVRPGRRTLALAVVPAWRRDG
jgi:hypothetical protein